MTNLSPKNSKNSVLITTEKVVFLIPVITGILTALIFTFSILAPLSKRLNSKIDENIILTDKITYIPVYKKLIKKLKESKTLAINQQERLLALVAGTDKIRTLTSKLNKLALNNSCSVVNFTPKGVKIFNPSSNDDPLLTRKVERHLYEIALQGEYNSLIAFMQDLELLQTVVITHNMDIEVLNNTKPFDVAHSFNGLNNKLQMTLGISVYGRTIR